jgi:hypothetical protein
MDFAPAQAIIPIITPNVSSCEGLRSGTMLASFTSISGQQGGRRPSFTGPSGTNVVTSTNNMASSSSHHALDHHMSLRTALRIVNDQIAGKQVMRKIPVPLSEVPCKIHSGRTAELLY